MEPASIAFIYSNNLTYSVLASQKKVVLGETAVIDPRFVNDFGLGKLVEVIERCFVYNPDKRADINEIKQMLEQAIADTEQYEKEEAVRLAEAEKLEEEEQREEEARQQQKEKQEQLRQQFEREKERVAKEILAKSKAESAGAKEQNADPGSIDHNGGKEAKTAFAAKDPVP